MQAKEKLLLPHGRKVKTLLLVLSLLTPLLSSAWSFDHDYMVYSETCYFDPFIWMPNDQKDRRVTLHMHMLKDADVALFLEVVHKYKENGKTNIESNIHIRPGIDPWDARQDYRHYKKGQVIDFDVEVPYSKMRIGDVEQCLNIQPRVLVAPETVVSWIISVPYGYVSPKYIIDVNHPFSNHDTFAGYYSGYSYSGTERYATIRFSGLKNEYEVDSQGILPLEDMKFEIEGYDYSLSALTMKKGELRFYNYLDDFDIGIRGIDEANEPFVSVPLELLPKGKQSYLRSKKFLYTKLDGRHQTNKYHSEREGYTFTTSVFLPPVKGTKARFYDCQLRLEGVGAMNADTIIHNFTAFRYSNEIGSKINSRFYVTEVKV